MAEPGAEAGGNRRKRDRVALSLTMHVLRAGSTCLLVTKTTNISSEGFYCIVPEPLNIGEIIHAVIRVSAVEIRFVTRLVALDCVARVLRVEPKEGGRYGLACHIEEYSVATWGGGPGDTAAQDGLEWPEKQSRDAGPEMTLPPGVLNGPESAFATGVIYVSFPAQSVHLLRAPSGRP